MTPVPNHGTTDRYSRFGCRCEACKAAKAAALMDNQGTYTFTAVTPDDGGRPFVVWSYGEGDDPEVLCTVEDAEFAEHIAKYDPAHTALMEAYVKAHEDYYAETGSTLSIETARTALDTYRKERGLDG